MLISNNLRSQLTVELWTLLFGSIYNVQALHVVVANPYITLTDSNFIPFFRIHNCKQNPRPKLHLLKKSFFFCMIHQNLSPHVFTPTLTLHFLFPLSLKYLCCTVISPKTFVCILKLSRTHENLSLLFYFYLLIADSFLFLDFETKGLFSCGSYDDWLRTL
jgi:hypothetical protein